MFGSCALSKKSLTFLFLLLFPLGTWAQAVKATVINDGALVYREADFDAPVITSLKVGGVFSISKGKKGPFHKIRLKPGTLGWIADTDVKAGVFKVTSVPQEKAESEVEQKENIRKQKPYFASRYRGPVLEMINFTEDTLGRELNAPTLFYGMKFSGFNTAISGDIYAESNVLVHFGAPSYYSDYTKKSADGFVVLGNVLLQTVMPKGKNLLYFYGFGPVVKYSHFTLMVPNNNESTYSADDLTLGAVINLGIGARVWDMSLRSDLKYYWETTKYLSLGVSLGWNF